MDYEKMHSNASPLELWYNGLINKSIDELSILDISRMLRQGVLLDMAMTKAMDILISNPFEGEIYDGDLLKQVIRALKSKKVF
ncbi:contact-dependent growth inhibition system immunity protein [Butyrivibrio sp. INlla21]|uniref:contact-dependent growth inhibition system immunity protein n=1 Tax=Butyrivibrio sp. INlla21 TaxID=1520811 RepID=UPI000B8769F5|nr:contact-dependent growth inhibition system immunity protein [Butyrivibrio sp. INlla21]